MDVRASEPLVDRTEKRGVERPAALEVERTPVSPSPTPALPPLEEMAPLPRPARSARRLSRTVQIVLLLVGGGAVAAYLLIGRIGSKVEPAPPPKSASADSFKPTDAQWAGFKTAQIRTMPFSASQVTDGKIAIDDDLTTAVFSPYTGRVIKLVAKAGDEVHAGDPLFSIQASEFVQGANDLVAAVAADRTTKAQLGLAVTTEKRQHDLYLAQGGALKDWQQSQSDLANAQGAYSSAEVALGAVRNRLRILGKTDREIATMEQGANATRFSPETVVQAPISGTIIQRQVGLGQNIVTQLNGGSTPVFTIGDTSRVWLLANARETDAPQIHVGDAVEVRVLAFPGRIFRATITYVAATLDATTHRLPIHAEIENPGRLLKPEMFASFRIITGQASQSLAAPRQALVFDADGAHVWLASPEKTLSVRKVKVGRTDGDMVEITEGLQAGDTVVTSGSLFIDRAAEAD